MMEVTCQIYQIELGMQKFMPLWVRHCLRFSLLLQHQLQAASAQLLDRYLCLDVKNCCTYSKVEQSISSLGCSTYDMYIFCKLAYLKHGMAPGGDFIELMGSHRASAIA